MLNRESLLGLAAAFLTLLFVFLNQKPAKNANAHDAASSTREQFSANYGTPKLDGAAGDEVWQAGEWLPLNQVWLGETPSSVDFSGRYKLAWDENNLYLLAEITDDTLVDTHPDGLEKYWDDDCLEIFVDENASGGNHQYNYNAFAYHVALDGKCVDIRPDSSYAYFNHCLTRRKTVGKRSTWEVAIQIYDGNRFNYVTENIPKLLSAGKKMGFALAYCDNDFSKERENFIGSVKIEGPDKNRAWIDASVFGLLTLK